MSPKVKSQLKYRIVRRSIDARNDILYRYKVEVYKPDEVMTEYVLEEYKNVADAEPVIIIGAGPAGMFAALLLAQHGYRPIVLERGQDVDRRVQAVEGFWHQGLLDPQTNVQFGEGGAGTFSDGKLNTLVKDNHGRSRFVLKTFVEFGAKEDILYESKPHIGTDILIDVVRNMRNEIISLGGDIRFNTQVTDIRVENEQITAVQVRARQT